jgi:hypothetical protein
MILEIIDNAGTDALKEIKKVIEEWNYGFWFII